VKPSIKDNQATPKVAPTMPISIFGPRPTTRIGKDESRETFLGDALGEFRPPRFHPDDTITLTSRGWAELTRVSDILPHALNGLLNTALRAEDAIIKPVLDGASMLRDAVLPEEKKASGGGLPEPSEREPEVSILGERPTVPTTAQGISEQPATALGSSLPNASFKAWEAPSVRAWEDRFPVLSDNVFEEETGWNVDDLAVTEIEYAFLCALRTGSFGMIDSECPLEEKEAWQSARGRILDKARALIEAHDSEVDTSLEI
jgi:hypothetical protein